MYILRIRKQSYKLGTFWAELHSGKQNEQIAIVEIYRFTNHPASNNYLFGGINTKITAHGENNDEIAPKASGSTSSDPPQTGIQKHLHKKAKKDGKSNGPTVLKALQKDTASRFT